MPTATSESRRLSGECTLTLTLAHTLTHTRIWDFFLLRLDPSQAGSGHGESLIGPNIPGQDWLPRRKEGAGGLAVSLPPGRPASHPSTAAGSETERDAFWSLIPAGLSLSSVAPGTCRTPPPAIPRPHQGSVLSAGRPFQDLSSSRTE